MGTSDAARLRFEAMAAEYLERMGERIRSRREELGMSRGDLARELPGKTNENAVYRWETGKHRPHNDTLEALASVLKVDPSFFLAADPQPGTADLLNALDHSDRSQLDRIEAKLDDILKRLDAAKITRRSAAAIARAEADRLADTPAKAPRAQRDTRKRGRAA